MSQKEKDDEGLRRPQDRFSSKMYEISYLASSGDSLPFFREEWEVQWEAWGTCCHSSWEGQKENKEILLPTSIPDPQLLRALDSLSSCLLGLSPKCILLALLNKIISTCCLFSALSSVNDRPPCKSVVEGPRTGPGTSDGW